MNLKEYIKVYDNIIPHDVCDDIIKCYEKCVGDPNSSRLHDDNHKKFQEMNLQKNTDTYGAANYEILHNAFTEIFQNYRSIIWGGKWVPVTSSREPLKVKKYPPNGHFKQHIDCGRWETMTRFLSAFVYLNESEGTQFWDDYTIEGKKGRVVVFPPNWMFPHKSLNGDKVKYFMGTYALFDHPLHRSKT